VTSWLKAHALSLPPLSTAPLATSYGTLSACHILRARRDSIHNFCTGERRHFIVLFSSFPPLSRCCPTAIPPLSHLSKKILLELANLEEELHYNLVPTGYINTCSPCEGRSGTGGRLAARVRSVLDAYSSRSEHVQWNDFGFLTSTSPAG